MYVWDSVRVNLVCPFLAQSSPCSVSAPKLQGPTPAPTPPLQYRLF